jgi:O-antigen ligase
MEDIFGSVMVLILFSIILLYFFFLVLRKPLIGLILTIMTIPLDGQGKDVGYITLTPSNFFLLTTFLGYFSSISLRKKFAPKIPAVLIIVWILYIFTGLFSLWTSSPQIRIFYTLIGCFMLYLLLVSLVKNEEALKQISFGYGISSFIQIVLALIQIYLNYKGISWRIYQYTPSGSDFRFIRPLGLHSDPNYYGIFMLPLFGILGAMLLEAKSIRIRMVSILFFILISIGIFVSFSRAAWLGGIVILCILFFLYSLQKINISSHILQTCIIFIVLIAIIALVFIDVLPIRKVRFIDQIIGINEPSYFYRYLTFKESLILWTNAPIFGYGTSDVTTMYVHNVFLQIMLRAGLYGLILFIIIFGYAFFLASKSMIISGEFSWFTCAIIRGYAAGFFAIILTSLLFGFEGHKMIWFMCGITTAIGLNFNNLKNNY